jgi:iron complex transport system substrate-binding protein
MVLAGLYQLLSRREAASPGPSMVTGSLRILSLSPNVTEILFRLGLGDQVVGVTDFCRYPPEALEKPKVGGLLNPSLERMFALDPSLAILLPAHGDLPEKLSSRGIRSLVVRNERVEDVLESIRRIGGETGRVEAAVALVDSMEAAVAAIKGGPPPRARKTMIVVGRAAGTIDDVSVAGAGTFLDQLLRMAGGKNVFDRSLVPYPQPGLEEILHRNPEVILELRPEGVSAEVESRAALSAWSALPGLEAVKRRNVFVLTEEYIVVPGPRFDRALQRIAEALREAR